MNIKIKDMRFRVSEDGIHWTPDFKGVSAKSYDELVDEIKTIKLRNTFNTFKRCATQVGGAVLNATCLLLIFYLLIKAVKLVWFL